MLRILALLLLISSQVVADLDLVTWDVLGENFYKMDIGKGDEAIIHIADDATCSFLPTITNQSYNNPCWATCQLDEEDQILVIKGADRCRFLRGTYKIYKEGPLYRLKDVHGGKQILFKQILATRQ